MRFTHAFLVLVLPLSGVQSGTPAKSHAPLRTLPPPAQRPLAQGPAFFVDAGRGDDKGDGSKSKPWRTLAHALKRLHAGDTLYLRGGVYYENVYLALAGTKNAPITLRSFPGERAVLDGGLREFFENPADCWEPFAKGGKNEYRSKKTYPNLREVLGSFGDSMIGLQTYYHAQDLRADNELIDWLDWNDTANSDYKPLYCGPGIWYDRSTGYLHARLAHTHLPEPTPNYRGPTDPRLLPLVLTPFHSVTLTIDQARHVRLQDLVLRGGGYTTIAIDQADHIEFDNVTVWCGTYGLRVSGTRNLRLVHSALYGNVAPWTFRTDGSKRDYPGRPHRNISRLNTHALLEIDNGGESSVYATPQNDHWEIAHSEFTDAHDGLYLGGVNVRFHHNLLDNFQDDGLYLSPMYFRHRLDKTDPEIHIYQNLFRGLLTALAFGGPEPQTRDKLLIYRNLFDLRAGVPTGRPSTKSAAVRLSSGKLIGDHGSPPWPSIFFYHNTCVAAEPMRSASMDTYGGTKSGLSRRVFNNIFYHLARLPAYAPPNPADNAVADGNLFWSLAGAPKLADTFFAKFHATPLFAQSQKLYPPGTDRNSLVADPGFIKLAAEPNSVNDYRLGPKSAALDKGVVLPKDWPDPLRELDKEAPDIGALPAGAILQVGRSK